MTQYDCRAYKSYTFLSGSGSGSRIGTYFIWCISQCSTMCITDTRTKPVRAAILTTRMNHESGTRARHGPCTHRPGASISSSTQNSSSLRPIRHRVDRVAVDRLPVGSYRGPSDEVRVPASVRFGENICLIYIRSVIQVNLNQIVRWNDTEMLLYFSQDKVLNLALTLSFGLWLQLWLLF